MISILVAFVSLLIGIGLARWNHSAQPPEDVTTLLTEGKTKEGLQMGQLALSWNAQEGNDDDGGSDG